MLKPFRLASKKGNAKALTLAVALAATGLTAFSAQAQTVVIGGTGGQSVQVNMGAAVPAQQPFYNPAPSSSQAPQQDYSKGSRIVYGEEVIVLTPPGSKPKKKAVVAKKKKKPAAKVAAKPKKETVKAEVKKPAPKPAQQEMKKEPPKVAEKKPEVPVTPRAPEKVAEMKEPAPQPKVQKPETQVEKTVAEKTSTPQPVAQEKQQPIEKAPTPKVEKEVIASPAPAAEEKKPMEVAALTPEKKAAPVERPAPKKEISTPAIKSDATNQILFEAEKTSLPGGADTQLKKLAALLKSGEDRVQLIAYADAGSNSAARRLSLGRALEVRSKLMDFGIPNNRIEVRALGRPKDDSPADRVDLKVIAR